jgi:hypothetical protein
MPRPKKTNTRKTANKKTNTKQATQKGKSKPKSANKAKGTKQSKGLQSEINQLAIRRPSPNLQPSINIINMITTDLHSIIEALDNFAANLRALDRCRKAKGFSAWSLRYAQTPHINSWSFAKGKTPMLSGTAG